jgi:hypothetical protein
LLAVVLVARLDYGIHNSVAAALLALLVLVVVL